MNIYKTIVACIIAFALILSTSITANAEESVRKKADFNQSIKKDRWVTLSLKP